MNRCGPCQYDSAVRTPSGLPQLHRSQHLARLLSGNGIDEEILHKYHRRSFGYCSVDSLIIIL